MSRSWERMVERNSKNLNKKRKKEGKQAIAAPAQQIDRFQGRSYVVPTLLLVLVIFFILETQPWSSNSSSPSLFWVTVGCYALLALFYYMRKPYLSVGKDFLETRRFSGYKRLKPVEIRKIVVRPGDIVIETVKGGNWMFSRLMNRFPIERMGERLQAFAALHHIEWEQKSK